MLTPLWVLTTPKTLDEAALKKGRALSQDAGS